jgi:ferredoxin
VRLVVDLTRCQGYGQCVFAAPEVFRMHGDEALLYEPNPGDEQRERVLRAAAACPVRAIVLDDRVGEATTAAETRAADAAGVERIVIVGASLAGLRAAHTLRRDGFTGSLARRLENPRLLADPPPYRPNPVLRGPRHLPVGFDRVRPTEQPVPHRGMPVHTHAH